MWLILKYYFFLLFLSFLLPSLSLVFFVLVEPLRPPLPRPLGQDILGVCVQLDNWSQEWRSGRWEGVSWRTEKCPGNKGPIVLSRTNYPELSLLGQTVQTSSTEKWCSWFSTWDRISQDQASWNIIPQEQLSGQIYLGEYIPFSWSQNSLSWELNVWAFCPREQVSRCELLGKLYTNL